MGAFKRFATRVFSKNEPTANPEHEQQPAPPTRSANRSARDTVSKDQTPKTVVHYRAPSSLDSESLLPMPLVVKKVGPNNKPEVMIPSGAPKYPSNTRRTRQMHSNRPRQGKASHSRSPSKISFGSSSISLQDAYNATRAMQGGSPYRRPKAAKHKATLSRMSTTASEWACQLQNEYDNLVPSNWGYKSEVEQVAQKRAELAQIMDRMRRIEDRLAQLGTQRRLNGLESTMLSNIMQQSEEGSSALVTTPKPSPRSKGHRIDRPLSSASRLTIGLKQTPHQRNRSSRDMLSSRSSRDMLSSRGSRDLLSSRGSRDMLSTRSVSIDWSRADANWLSYTPKRRASGNRKSRHSRMSIETTRSSVLFPQEQPAPRMATPMRIYAPTLRVVEHRGNSSEASPQSLQACVEESPSLSPTPEQMGPQSGGLQRLKDTAPPLYPRIAELRTPSPKPRRRAQTPLLLEHSSTQSTWSCDVFNSEYGGNMSLHETPPLSERDHDEEVADCLGPHRQTTNLRASWNATIDRLRNPKRVSGPAPSASLKRKPPKFAAKRRSFTATVFTKLNPKTKTAKRTHPARSAVGPRVSPTPPSTPPDSPHFTGQELERIPSMTEDSTSICDPSPWDPSPKPITATNSRSPSVLPGLITDGVGIGEPPSPLNDATEAALARTVSKRGHRTTYSHHDVSPIEDAERSLPRLCLSPTPARSSASALNFSRPGRPSMTASEFSRDMYCN